MLSRPKNREGPVTSLVKGISIGAILFFILSLGIPPAHALTSGTNWEFGVYYKGTYTNGSLSGVTNLGANFYNTGMPAPSGTATYAVLTLTINGTNSFVYLPQISIENIQDGSFSGYYLYAVLLNSAGQLITGFGNQSPTDGEYINQVSGLSTSWHTLTLGTTSLVVGNTNYEYLEFYLDGTAYTSWRIATCTTPCSFSSSLYYVNNWIVPNFGLESYDSTNADFSSTDVHGYFQVSGTNTGSMYLYPANYGYQHGCPLPSGAQKSTLYLASNVQAPGNADLTGHVYDATWGATNEWGIGKGDTTGYNQVTDSQLSSTFCSSGPPQIA